MRRLGADTAVLATLVRMSLLSGRGHLLLLGLIEESAILALGLAAPFLLKRIVDQISTLSAFELSLLLAAFALSWVAPSLVAALKAPKTAVLTDDLYRTISMALIRRQLPVLASSNQDDSARLAGVLERLSPNLQGVFDGLVWRVGPLVGQLFLGLVALAFSLPLIYAALLGAALALYLALSFGDADRLSQRIEIFKNATANVSFEVGDVLRNADRVVCNGAVGFEASALDRKSRPRALAQIGLAHALVGSAVLQVLALGLGLGAVLILAGLDVRAGRLKLGDFVLLQAFAIRLAMPLGGVVITFRQSGLFLSGIREALALGGTPSKGSAKSDSDLALVGDLELRAVSYTHSDGQGVDEISLRLAPDQTVAVVGFNGSGKSTLGRLIAGILRPDDGAVLIDGRPLERLSEVARAATVLYAPQHTSLLNRPLVENGLYPPAQTSAAPLERRLLEWSFGEPVLHRLAGESAAALSGGQVQKLELARLCSVEAAILILDETTSALDAASEAEVLRTLRAAFAGRLLVHITHNRRLAEEADTVLLLKDGRIAAQGTPAALQTHLDYQNLWVIQ